jgi:hypothetical protein
MNIKVWCKKEKCSFLTFRRNTIYGVIEEIREVDHIPRFAMVRSENDKIYSVPIEELQEIKPHLY